MSSDVEQDFLELRSLEQALADSKQKGFGTPTRTRARTEPLNVRFHVDPRPINARSLLMGRENKPFCLVSARVSRWASCEWTFERFRTESGPASRIAPVPLMIDEIEGVGRRNPGRGGRQDQR